MIPLNRDIGALATYRCQSCWFALVPREGGDTPFREIYVDEMLGWMAVTHDLLVEDVNGEHTSACFRSPLSKWWQKKKSPIISRPRLSNCHQRPFTESQRGMNMDEIGETWHASSCLGASRRVPVRRSTSYHRCRKPKRSRLGQWAISVGGNLPPVALMQKCALSKLGNLGSELLMGQDKAPIWPDGFTGSITHTANAGGWGILLRQWQSAGPLGRIGIDAEYIPAVQPQSWAQFLTGREMQFARSMPVSYARSCAASAIWCAKEAASKAMGRPVEPPKDGSAPGAAQLCGFGCMAAKSHWRSR